jgi:hypothetical protein
LLLGRTAACPQRQGQQHGQDQDGDRRQREGGRLDCHG